ncbi:photosynthetic complex assembly protein PuhC [Lichenicoccus sp.]|uniref:photosynthetic complex assembly protein PuhC n=1 Tax=Lichenicoccus sp. TaxID=2781899 RepID=UPI003D0B0E57
MSSAASQPAFPWPPFIALIAVGVIAVVAVWPTRPLHDGAKVVASRELRFVLQPDDSMQVIDAKTDRVAGVVPTIRDGFVPGMLHGMDIIRKHDGVAKDLPYRITEMSDGRVLLIDPPTKSEIDLESFGSANAQRFVAYLRSQEGHSQEGTP